MHLIKFYKLIHLHWSGPFYTTRPNPTQEIGKSKNGCALRSDVVCANTSAVQRSPKPKLIQTNSKLAREFTRTWTVCETPPWASSPINNSATPTFFLLSRYASFFLSLSLCLSLIVIMVLIVVVTTTAAQVLARIEVAVLNFLRVLTSPAPAISDLPLVLSVNSLSVNLDCNITDQSRIPHSFTFSLSKFSRLPNRTSQAASKPNFFFIIFFLSESV